VGVRQAWRSTAVSSLARVESCDLPAAGWQVSAHSWRLSIVCAEFEGLSASELRAAFNDGSPVPRDYYIGDLPDLVRIEGPFFVATQLDDVCRTSTSRFGRIAACGVTGREFPGRCQAYRLMKSADSEGITGNFVTRALSSCDAGSADLSRQLRANDLPLRGFYGWSLTPERRRVAMRLYASAMDREFHEAACEAAAPMPGARDIPECHFVFRPSRPPSSGGPALPRLATIRRLASWPPSHNP